jgi:hypothetical protein
MAMQYSASFVDVTITKPKWFCEQFRILGRLAQKLAISEIMCPFSRAINKTLKKVRNETQKYSGDIDNLKIRYLCLGFEPLRPQSWSTGIWCVTEC